ncbi:MAG TPA: nickel pincer cofactor biosynthesis protein LarC [Candidatus Aminicenantes bacterium]|nr:nickel pincer cofactor biosynthesis protein LarC [Candidatus Aminicenantes bacterium]HRY65462.1 nickel pincer cofactor biosynthesis protein LarC [Candidatus Aminicenantes bacterium]HRZ72070.1 nickel pincer cofactor biosynthesis protein LarC [Candidatus Aminicenantes bacterium]
MKYVYLDASSGLSGDMCLGALLDLGIDPALFRERLAGLRLPVEIAVRRVRRGGFAALKVDVGIRGHEHNERTLADVERIIARSRFAAAVKDRSLAVFRRLFEAEAKVHGRRLREAHLHEAGADDALVDIVGTAFLLEELGVGEVFCSPLNVGSGWVDTAHGRLAVPPPAVAELLKKAPVYSAWVESELVTPTGAAIVSALAAKFLRLPELVYEKIGRGAGTKEFPEIPNILRVYYGRAGSFDPGKGVYIVEATIDDSTPQLLAHFLERALEEGALDATLSPVVMKKNRLGTKLSLLVESARLDALIEAVFRETTSIGVRFYPVERRVLEREIRPVRVDGRRIGLKVARLGGRPVNVQPEYDDLVAAARGTGKPLKEIAHRAVSAFPGKR